MNKSRFYLVKLRRGPLEHPGVFLLVLREEDVAALGRGVAAGKAHEAQQQQQEHQLHFVQCFSHEIHRKPFKYFFSPDTKWNVSAVATRKKRGKCE